MYADCALGGSLIMKEVARGRTLCTCPTTISLTSRLARGSPDSRARASYCRYTHQHLYSIPYRFFFLPDKLLFSVQFLSALSLFFFRPLLHSTFHDGTIRPLDRYDRSCKRELRGDGSSFSLPRREPPLRE